MNEKFSHIDFIAEHALKLRRLEGRRITLNELTALCELRKKTSYYVERWYTSAALTVLLANIMHFMYDYILGM